MALGTSPEDALESILQGIEAMVDETKARLERATSPTAPAAASDAAPVNVVEPVEPVVPTPTVEKRPPPVYAGLIPSTLILDVPARTTPPLPGLGLVAATAAALAPSLGISGLAGQAAPWFPPPSIPTSGAMADPFPAPSWQQPGFPLPSLGPGVVPADTLASADQPLTVAGDSDFARQWRDIAKATFEAALSSSSGGDICSGGEWSSSSRGNWNSSWWDSWGDDGSRWASSSQGREWPASWNSWRDDTSFVSDSQEQGKFASSAWESWRDNSGSAGAWTSSSWRGQEAAVSSKSSVDWIASSTGNATELAPLVNGFVVADSRSELVLARESMPSEMLTAASNGCTEVVTTESASSIPRPEHTAVLESLVNDATHQSGEVMVGVTPLQMLLEVAKVEEKSNKAAELEAPGRGRPHSTLSGYARVSMMSRALVAQETGSSAKQSSSAGESVEETPLLSVFIGNLPMGTAEGLIKAETTKYGQIVSITRKPEPWDPLLGGWAIVKYASCEMAMTAMQKMSRKSTLFGTSASQLEIRNATKQELGLEPVEPMMDEMNANVNADPAHVSYAQPPSSVPRDMGLMEDSSDTLTFARSGIRGGDPIQDRRGGGLDALRERSRSRGRVSAACLGWGGDRQGGRGREEGRIFQGRNRRAVGPDSRDPSRTRTVKVPVRTRSRGAESRSPVRSSRNSGGRDAPSRQKGRRRDEYDPEEVVAESRHIETRRGDGERRNVGRRTSGRRRAAGSASSSSMEAIVAAPARKTRVHRVLGGFDKNDDSDLVVPTKTELVGGTQICVRGDWAKMAIGNDKFYYMNMSTKETRLDMPPGFVNPAWLQDQRPYGVCNNKLYINGLPFAWDDAMLAHQFMRFGQVTTATINRESSGRPVGSGYVIYGGPGGDQAAQAAILNLNGVYVGGLWLKVTMSKY